MNQFELFTQSVLLGLQAIGGVLSTIPAIEQLHLIPVETLTHLAACVDRTYGQQHIPL